MGFFYIALEEIYDNVSEQIRYNSLSHRLSKLENVDFEKFMKDDDEPNTKPKKIVVDHASQMKKAERI